MTHILGNKWFYHRLPVVAITMAAMVVFIFTTGRAWSKGYDGTLGTGVGAKLACSGVYLMGRDPQEVIKRDLRRFYYPLLKDASFDFDIKKKTVSATIGKVTRTALYRPGIGCTLMIDTDRDKLLAQANGIKENSRKHRPYQWPEGDIVTLHKDSKNIDWHQLDKAIDGAFEDNTEHKIIDTRAIIVVYDGKIIAERYARGFDSKSHFLSWSASKSVTSALIGTLVTDKKLALYDPAPVPVWSSGKDTRHQISLHHLITMTSGLEFTEPYIPDNDSTDMLFKNANMADFAIQKPLSATPGSLWSYSSGTTNILSRILFDQTGGSLKSLHSYATDRFFSPLGMSSAIFEVDVSGAHVGSSYFYATAQDWARFGLLFLNEGKVKDKQLLSKDWVEYSKTPTPLAPKGEYGAQFWLNGGHPERDEGHMLPDCPTDMYMANGYAGQHIGIVPSKKAIVVRLGWTTKGAKFDTNKHFSEILKTLPNTI
jgi:CubicO group peptidase (beta-lactamase class C family)